MSNPDTTSKPTTPAESPAGEGLGARNCSECFCGGKGWVMLVGMGAANRRIPCPDCNSAGWPICDKCGERIRYNAPRIGPMAGYVHQSTGKLQCSTIPNKQICESERMPQQGKS
jgi:hypothetical protein